MLLETGYIGIGYVLCLIVSKLKNKFMKQNCKPEIFCNYVLTSNPIPVIENIIENVNDIIPSIDGLQYIIDIKYLNATYTAKYSSLADKQIERIKEAFNFKFQGSLKNFQKNMLILLKSIYIDKSDFENLPTIFFKIILDIDKNSMDPVLASFDYRHTKFLKP